MNADATHSPPRDSAAPSTSALPPTDPQSRRAWNLAAAVFDPEVPVLTVEDLGILRQVAVTARDDTWQVTVDITPTYSGCPALDAIRDDITAALHGGGYPNVEVRTVLAPAWTTDWMTDAGRTKLQEFGIAPPAPRVDGRVSLGLGIRCPHCGSLHTRELSRFGSTSCKALYTCLRCLEPFDYFKTH
ncbi:MAG TPA: 1,2-phenylacetyl-CoA epoxidase subunit PaaD [Candidatus Lumbricidophila sp.]|nr:1,2-phenylacetyl-CoA epoxidase subunit PaaD [Candidatus Lumbricidophila sp.]